VVLAGQVGLAGHLEIGDNVIVGAQSGVPGNLPANGMYSGSPTVPHKEFLKYSMTLAHLPVMRKTLSSLVKKVEELEKQLAEK